jgi:hypothetical protein
VIRELGDTFVDELWLDHDLGGHDTIRPVTSCLEELAYSGTGTAPAGPAPINSSALLPPTDCLTSDNLTNPRSCG